ncbi:MAG TPA: D-alanyl-D-alanine carboxypeptidase/D-alanyl-D-alanine-endopeptidase [Phnomibacter sp.]|nr:D-alanyl-D-alanine carboxypeptidase/D-alanyl-D-alanine-endopeptidase [Phnomibacter sp.]
MVCATGKVLAQADAKAKAALQKFLADEQLKYASTGFVLADAQTGATLYSHQPNTGLAPASTQKVITSAAALGMVGPKYQFATRVLLGAPVVQGVLQGPLLVQGSGDPTMGSWRYPSQPDTAFFYQVWQALRKAGIQQIAGGLVGHNTHFSVLAIPGSWMYDDIGNYYGAGCWALNWRENQYDAAYNPSGRQGETMPTPTLFPQAGIETFNNYSRVGAAGTGDNTIIYSAPYAKEAYALGSIGKQAKPFTIAGSVPNGEGLLLQALHQYLTKRGIQIAQLPRPSWQYASTQTPLPTPGNLLTEYRSVTLDSVIYWFMQKSINLYGEAIAKTLAYQKKGFGDTDTGVELMKDYWAQHGIDRGALRMQDGSGLSPQNRVTAGALTAVLLHARKQPWFAAYYQALPTINKTKMKSGTIGGVKGYAGYITDKTGRQYAFTFLVNNYSGSPTSLVQKMFAVLDAVL